MDVSVAPHGTRNDRTRDLSSHSDDLAGVLFDAMDREHLCDLQTELGPQPPTLLELWETTVGRSRVRAGSLVSLVSVA